MKSTTPRRAQRALIGATAIFIALTLGAGTVLAETELGHTGKVGNHQINDVVENPVICHHDPDTGRLLSIEVHTVTIWSRDKTSGRDKQKVGWQLILKRKKDSQINFKTIYKSGIMKANAWDDQSAFFPTRTINSVMFPDNTSRYLVLAKMLWYRDGAVVGTATHQFDFYKEDDGVQFADLPYCSGRFLN